MNRSAASATYYPFQVMPRFLFGRQEMFIILAEATFCRRRLRAREKPGSWRSWGHQRKRKPNHFLLSTNLRLVVYIAKKF